MMQAEFDWETGKFPRAKSLEERFAEWIEGQGQDVYRTFVAIARQIRDSGQQRFGGKAIAEIARYQRIIAGHDAEGYKVNNVFVSRMVRKLIEDDGSFETFFELRRLRGETGE